METRFLTEYTRFLTTNTRYLNQNRALLDVKFGMRAYWQFQKRWLFEYSQGADGLVLVTARGVRGCDGQS